MCDSHPASDGKRAVSHVRQGLTKDAVTQDFQRFPECVCVCVWSAEKSRDDSWTDSPVSEENAVSQQTTVFMIKTPDRLNDVP